MKRYIPTETSKGLFLSLISVINMQVQEVGIREGKCIKIPFCFIENNEMQMRGQENVSTYCTKS